MIKLIKYKINKKLFLKIVKFQIIKIIKIFRLIIYF